MRKEVKNVLICAATGLHLVISLWILPLALCVAFNFMDGIRANEEGISFIPWGIGAVIATLAVDLWSVRKTLLMSRTQKHGPRIVATTLLVACVVGIALNADSWWFFFENLTYFKGMNLELQR